MASELEKVERDSIEKILAALRVQAFVTTDEATSEALGQIIDRIHDLEADRLAALDGGWRPIESAPRDGRNVWLYNGNEEPAQFEGFYADDPHGGYWAYAEELVMDVQGEAHPTHWQPLPPPPEGAKP